MEKKEKCGLTYTQCNLCFWGLIVDTIDTGFSWTLVMHMTQDIEGFISNLQKMVTGSQTSGDMVRPDNYKMTIASVLAACAHLGAFDHGLWVHEFTCWKKFLEVCSNIHFVLNFRLQCHEFYFHSDTSRSNKIRY
ncbi:unnamed protein product [Prunus armeniaca]|uniref:Uncharacterized protein n=1 Tax=Prunus armeniaca TaxID=36596 RepID=A0A6J5WW27_PRUAR|nr:unnamed protein product [Prunus armeniaca]